MLLTAEIAAGGDHIRHQTGYCTKARRHATGGTRASAASMPSEPPQKGKSETARMCAHPARQEQEWAALGPAPVHRLLHGERAAARLRAANRSARASNRPPCLRSKARRPRTPKFGRESRAGLTTPPLRLLPRAGNARSQLPRHPHSRRWCLCELLAVLGAHKEIPPR